MPFRSSSGRVHFVATTARIVLATALLAACQRATPTSTQPPADTPAGLSALPSGLPATVPASETPHFPPAGEASPTGPAYQMSAGTRAPSPTITPSLTPDLLACLPEGPPDEVGQVQWVSDGDTIVVELPGGRKSVRYLGIDAPAYLPNSRFFGPPAYQHNRQLVEGQIVSLYRDGPDSDGRGQLLRYVVARGVFVNLELVRMGMARAISVLDHGAAAETTLACGASLQQAEQAAHTAQIGVWSEQVVAALVTSQAANNAPPAPVPNPVPNPAPRPSATPLIQATSPLPATATLTLAPGASATAASTHTGTPATPTHTLQPTITQAGGTPTNTRPVSGQTVITINYVDYAGTPAQQESDESVEITNEGSTPIVMTGWRLVSQSTNARFTFPEFTMQPGAICYIYTNQVVSGTCVNDSFRSPSGIWAESDCALLYDTNNLLHDELCWPDE